MSGRSESGTRPKAGRPVLVVDDNESNRDFLTRRLSHRGCHVTSVASGEEAVMVATPERFHLVLLDVMMPGMNGLDVLRELRLRYSPTELPIVMVTARGESDDVVQSLSLGANDHVVKPVDLPVLIARIETQLRLRELARVKDEFLRIASHDLKNPLDVLSLGVAHLSATLPAGARMTEKAHVLLDRMALRCRGMQRIINDFLDFQAMEDGALAVRRASTDLNVLARQTAEALEPVAVAKSIALHLELDDTLQEVFVDSARLAQVFDNLLGNAVKYCGAGDSVTLRTRQDGRHATIEVVDTGPGLPEGSFERVFEKYVRMPVLATGGEHSSGLGLFICRQIVELHGGRIGAMPNPDGRGTVFWLSLALADEPIAAAG